MDTNTKQIIDGLFERLAQAEKQNSNRDREAESLIEKHVVAHPAAPYYMAQTMVMQEATIKQLHAQVEQLKTELTQTQAQAQQKAPEVSFRDCLAVIKTRATSNGKTTLKATVLTVLMALAPTMGAIIMVPIMAMAIPVPVTMVLVIAVLAITVMRKMATATAVTGVVTAS